MPSESPTTEVIRRRADPDETDGRKVYRAMANYQARLDLATAIRKITITPEPTDEELVRWLETEIDFHGTDENIRMYDAIRKRLGADYV